MASSVSIGHALGTPPLLAELDVPFLKSLEKPIQGFFVQGLELAARTLLVRTFSYWGPHLFQ
jgi:hypothetical protein